MRISDWSSDVCSSDLSLSHARGDDARRQRPSEGRWRMTRVALLLAGIAPLVFAVPAAAPPMDHSMHGAATAPTPAPSPTPTPAPVAQPEHYAPHEATRQKRDPGNHYETETEQRDGG